MILGSCKSVKSKLMKNNFILLLLILIISCNQKKDKVKLDVNQTKAESKLLSILEGHKKNALSKLNLQPINKLPNKTLRIWRFPSGGAVFSELYELNIDKHELILYSYLIEKIDERKVENLSEIEFVAEIKDKKIIDELTHLTQQNSFFEIDNSYCKEKPSCNDSYLIEFKNNDTYKTFELESNIKKCNSEKAKTIKNLYTIIEKLIRIYNH